MIKFDPTQFIVTYADVFVTVGGVVALGVMTLCVSTIALFIVLRTEQ